MVPSTTPETLQNILHSRVLVGNAPLYLLHWKSLLRILMYALGSHGIASSATEPPSLPPAPAVPRFQPLLGEHAPDLCSAQPSW